jgi:hypothetical protein
MTGTAAVNQAATIDTKTLLTARRKQGHHFLPILANRTERRVGKRPICPFVHAR